MFSGSRLFELLHNPHVVCSVLTKYNLCIYKGKVFAIDVRNFFFITEILKYSTVDKDNCFWTPASVTFTCSCVIS